MGRVNVMAVQLIRHAPTAGNAEKRYIGARTDEPLSPEGVLVASENPDPTVKKVFTSPMVRCKQTAKLMFPNAEIEVIEDFREMDFGYFEGKNFNELADNYLYTEWVNAMCEPAPPGGESLEDFNRRVRKAFSSLLKKHYPADIFIVAHGGTIMSIMSYLHPDKPYYEYHVKPCGRFVIEPF
jgi:alpha-ribazole phosphatase